MARLINFGLHAVTISLLILVLRGQRKIGRKEDAMTDQEQKLVDDVNALAEAVDNEEALIDTIIDALKQPHDSPIVAQVIANLEATKAKVAGFHNPPPPPPPPLDGGE